MRGGPPVGDLAMFSSTSEVEKPVGCHPSFSVGEDPEDVWSAQLAMCLYLLQILVTRN